LAAHTELPLSVNANNELQVTRPDGTTKVLTILPDQVAAKMQVNGVSVGPDAVNLVTSNSGDPVYEVDHSVTKKLLGLFNMQFGVQSTVSATAPGSVTTVSTETSPLRKLLEQLSI
jgi:hypothetical protein